LEDKPCNSELNVPNPDPSVVFVDNEMVGFGFVDQTTPLAITGEPPSEITFPPLVDAFGVMFIDEFVRIDGCVDTHIGLPSLSALNI
jgi:hypothetical protein